MRMASAIALAAWGCEIQRPEVRSVPVATPGVVRGAVKVHLLDGSALLFADSVTLTRDAVTGLGRRFDLLGADDGLVSGVPMDSVAAVVVFTTDTEGGKSALVSLGVVLLFIVVGRLITGPMLSGHLPFGGL
jgi:hypothetical protein